MWLLPTRMLRRTAGHNRWVGRKRIGDAGQPGDRLDDADELRRPENAAELAKARCKIGDADGAALRSVSTVETIAVLRRYSDWKSAMSSSTTSENPFSSSPGNRRQKIGSPSKRG